MAYIKQKQIQTNTPANTYAPEYSFAILLL